MIIHCSGRVSFRAIAAFDEVTVDGKTGPVVMFVAGLKPDIESEWQGYWVIVDGTGELEHLRGRGKWWGPGTPGPEVQGDIYYAGRIHFKPNKDK